MQWFYTLNQRDFYFFSANNFYQTLDLAANVNTAATTFTVNGISILDLPQHGTATLIWTHKLL